MTEIKCCFLIFLIVLMAMVISFVGNGGNPRYDLKTKEWK
jgi:hypothetical protein